MPQNSFVSTFISALSIRLGQISSVFCQLDGLSAQRQLFCSAHTNCLGTLFLLRAFFFLFGGSILLSFNYFFFHFYPVFHLRNIGSFSSILRRNPLRPFHAWLLDCLFRFLILFHVFYLTSSSKLNFSIVKSLQIKFKKNSSSKNTKWKKKFYQAFWKFLRLNFAWLEQQFGQKENI